jgi:Xaa-Pro aminopeptidase
MAHESQPESRPLGETTGTARRPKQRLAEPVLAYDLKSEAEALIRAARGVPDGRAAKTLAKVSRLHVVLTALRSGTRIHQHETQGSILIHLPDQRLELKPGMVVTLGPDIPHEVEAESDSAFLLSVAWASETGR